VSRHRCSIRDGCGRTKDGTPSAARRRNGRKIQQSVEEAQTALAELADRSQDIGDIIRVIDDIAGQTNLLALNAAIIAAQAANAGKDSQSVADRFRDLSERTSTSTDEIRTLIQNVQRSVERAAEQMTLSRDRVSDGVLLTRARRRSSRRFSSHRPLTKFRSRKSRARPTNRPAAVLQPRPRSKK